MRDISGILCEFGLVRRGDEAGVSAVVPRDCAVRDHLHVTHGGDPAALALGRSALVDASASINPLGPPDWLRQEIERSISDLCHYPEPTYQALRDTIAEHCGARSEQVVVGNGSSELLAWLPLVAAQKHWIVPVPSYGEYRRSAALAECPIATLPMGTGAGFALDWDALEQLTEGPTVAILGHPNNPTGGVLDVGRFRQLRRRHPQTLFVVDEAFADFCTDFVSTWDKSAENLLVLRSLTKSLAIPGLRLGYALASSNLAAALRERLPPWSVNLLAQRVGQRFFEDPQFLPQMRRTLVPLKEQLLDGLRHLPDCRIGDGVANWVMLDMSDTGLRARDVANSCRRHGVALRTCDDFTGLKGQWLRISLRNHDENEQVIRSLRHVLGVPLSRSQPKRTRANMSNNSGIAADGGEMDRAQVVQAWASGLKPDTRMNPVLLKPSSDRGAQVVERHTGRPVLGVVPYLKDLVLPDEDRLSLESGQRRFGSPDAPIRIAVFVPPHVSNATDIDPLTLETDVHLYLVELRQSQARHLPSGTEILGYEIHHGITDFSNVTSLFIDSDGRILGGGQPERRVWGTYIHGLLDSDAFRHEFLDGLRRRKGLSPLGNSRNVYSLEPSFKRIAEVFREYVDYGAICRLMGLT